MDGRPMSADSVDTEQPFECNNAVKWLRSEEPARNAFRAWRTTTHYNNSKLARDAFFSLSLHQRSLLSNEAIVNLPQVFRAQDDAIDSNAAILEAILETSRHRTPTPKPSMASTKFTHTDHDLTSSTLSLLYRDWSAETAEERKICHGPILDAATKHLACDPNSRHKHHILVPGSGLGRLVCEIVALGFTATANEFAPHHYIAINWLRFAPDLKPKQYQLYPFISNNSNHFSREDQMRNVLIPDTTPAEMAKNGTASAVPWSDRLQTECSDFCKMRTKPSHKGAFDAVATCFFIDTSANFFDYLENVRFCLKSGGIWINHGPLMWHHEQTRKKSPEKSGWGAFELTDEEVVKLVAACGFEILEHRRTENAGYGSKPQSMMNVVWRLSFWVARKL